MAIRFDESATGEDSDELFRLPRQACLRRDGDAPMQLSPQEAQVIKTYPEVQEARAALNDARAKFGRNAALTRRLATRLKYRIKTITAALLTEKREASFRRADRENVSHRFTNMDNLMCKVIAEATNTETTLTSRLAASKCG